MNSPPLTRYRDAVSNLPPPGCGCHTALLSAANYGALAGIAPQQIHNDLRRSIPPGSRKISDREIQDAIRKALADRNGGTFTPRPQPAPVVKDGKAAIQKIIQQCTISTEAELTAASPVSIPTDPSEQQRLFLKTVFRWDDFIFCGDREQLGTVKTIQPACHWLKVGAPGPFVIINPLSGYPAPLKSGDGETYRGDGNVSAYRYAMAEFDGQSREDQIKFWSAVRLPLVALINTGGKSIHAWLDVQKLAVVETSEQWATHIKDRLYLQILTPLGVDAACSNPARLSRMPGYYREEKGAWQRLLWLSAEGRTIC